MRGVTSMRRLSTALGFLWVVFGVSHTSSSSNSLLIGDLEATTTSDTTLQCAHIAKFSVVRADDATPITFMHHVCMHPTRGVVAEAQLSVQQLGRGLSDDQRREAFVTLVSKFAAFTSSQILASVPPEHEFRLLHVDEDSQSVPSSVFPVTIDGFTAEMRIFHGEPIQTRLSFFCRTWLLEEVLPFPAYVCVACAIFFLIFACSCDHLGSMRCCTARAHWGWTNLQSAWN